MLASGYESAPHAWVGLLASLSGAAMAVSGYVLVRHLRWELPFRAGLYLFLFLFLFLFLLAFGYLLVALSFVVPLLRGLTDWERALSLGQKVYAITMSSVAWVGLIWLYGRVGLMWRPKLRN